MPLIILINGKSASASEIVAAALQDHLRAVVIGSTSYGKGTVQTIIRLPNNGEIALTWSHFQTPSGYFLNGLGVPPSVCATGEEKPTAIEYIQAALKQTDKHIKKLRAWHTVNISQKRKRNRLKAMCPTTQKSNPLDRKIAEELLLNTSLYQRVIALTPSVASIN